MQLMVAVSRKPSRAPAFNPRPPGVIRKGSATEAVYKLLKAHPHMAYTHGQIVALTGRSPKAVDWGVLFLRRREMIMCFGDPRNSRYWVYQLRSRARSHALRWK